MRLGEVEKTDISKVLKIEEEMVIDLVRRRG